MCLGTNLSVAGQEEAPLTRKEARSYRELGLEAQKQGDLQDALAYYQKSIAMDPEYPVTYNDAGIVLEVMGSPEAAKAMYLKAIELTPNYPDSYSNLAMLYESEGDYANAVTCWMKRDTMGSYNDPWTEAARRRIGDIAQAYPEVYGATSKKYHEGITPSEADSEKESPAAAAPEQQESYQSEPVQTEPPAPPQGESTPVYPESEPVASREPENTPSIAPRSDNKARAANYLIQAKQNFSSRNYVTALKEATVAEYLDPDNSEISSFVAEVRKKLLE